MFSNRGRFNNRKNRNFYKPQRFQNSFQNSVPNRRNFHPKKYRHQDQLTEAEVGIQKFISTLDGYSGVIKARYSDFQVNEINLDGEIAKLTDTSVPRNFGKTEKKDYKKAIESPLEQIPQETWEQMKKVVNSDVSEPVNLEAENFSREDRGQIHKCVKSYFGQKIVASTVTVDGKKFMQFKKYNKAEKQDERFQWPEDKGEYVYFIMYKEALDTMDAVLKIGDLVGVSPSSITYAGVKDKRGKTAQWLCVRKVEPWKIIVKTRPLRNVKVGNITFKDEPLKLGQLQGNRFRIALRNVTANNDLINESLEHVKENGFVNYYGLQRFGNDREVPTYEIGVKLLTGQWKEAVDLILKPKNSDEPGDDVSRAKKIYNETRDASKAYAVLEANKNRSLEARLLEGLKKANANDYFNALEKIPRNMRLFYIHSFQSLIWNKMATARLELYGMEPREGDFILVEKNEDETTEETNNEENGKSEAEKLSAASKEATKAESVVTDASSTHSDDEEKHGKHSKMIQRYLPVVEPNVLESFPQFFWETKIYETGTAAFRKFLTFMQKYEPAEEPPLPNNSRNRKRNKWITKEIMDLIKHKEKLYKQYTKNKHNELLEHKFKEERNKINMLVKAAKRDYQLREEMKEKEREEEIKCKQYVRPLTADEVANYTIYDIVLPLPGYDIKYPEHLEGFYKEALEEYGLTLEMTKQKVKTYTLCGGYRKILQKAQNLSWKILRYNNPVDNLIRSDFEEMIKQAEPVDVPDGKYKAIVLDFTLPSSSYATMALREILKTDTSSSAQAQLNDYHKKALESKIITDTLEKQTKPEETEIMQTSSLLSDPDKFEEFKNTAFNDSLKRKAEDEEDGDSKKLKVGDETKEVEEEAEEKAEDAEEKAEEAEEKAETLINNFY